MARRSNRPDIARIPSHRFRRRAHVDVGRLDLQLVEVGGGDSKKEGREISGSLAHAIDVKDVHLRRVLEWPRTQVHALHRAHVHDFSGSAPSMPAWFVPASSMPAWFISQHPQSTPRMLRPRTPHERPHVAVGSTPFVPAPFVPAWFIPTPAMPTPSMRRLCTPYESHVTVVPAPFVSAAFVATPSMGRLRAPHKSLGIRLGSVPSLEPRRRNRRRAPYRATIL